MAVDKYTVPASILAPAVDPEQLGFKDTSELTPLSETIGGPSWTPSRHAS